MAKCEAQLAWCPVQSDATRVSRVIDSFYLLLLIHEKPQQALLLE